MGAKGCERCSAFASEASRAISAHMDALYQLAEAVNANADIATLRLAEEALREWSIIRRQAVWRLNIHGLAHETCTISSILARPVD